MSQFKAARAMANKLMEHKWKTDVELVLGELCDFRHKGLNGVAVLLNLHTVFNVFMRYLGPGSTAADSDLKLLAFEAMKFMVRFVKLL
jgi:hypothetical protein